MSTHRAEIEWLCEHAGLIRVFRGNRRHGDPYEWCVSFKDIGGDDIELVGCVRAPTPNEARAGLRLMRQCGLRVVGLRRSGARPGMRDVTRERV